MMCLFFLHITHVIFNCIQLDPSILSNNCNKRLLQHQNEVSTSSQVQGGLEFKKNIYYPRDAVNPKFNIFTSSAANISNLSQSNITPENHTVIMSSKKTKPTAGTEPQMRIVFIHCGVRFFENLGKHYQQLIQHSMNLLPMLSVSILSFHKYPKQMHALFFSQP